MKIKTKILSIAAVLLTLSGCVNKQKVSPGPDYMIQDEVVFATKFPHTIQLSEPVRIDVEIPGGLDFTIKDSLIIFSTQNPNMMWEFFSLPDFKYLGSHLRKGNGPNEFLSTPWLYSVSFSEKDGQLFSSIYDFNRGKMLKMNINESLAKSESDISVVKDSLPASLFDFVVLDDSLFLCREISEDRTHQNRYFLKNGVKSVSGTFEKMNQACVAPHEDFNILSTITGYNPKSNRIVEVPVKLNYLNIYSLDGSFGKTLCMEKKMDNISEIQLLDRTERRNTFGCLCIYDNMFGVLYGDSERDETSTIWFFDMDGEPLMEFKLDGVPTTFDIDFKGGYLYTHDFKTEDFHKYDIGKYLVELK